MDDNDVWGVQNSVSGTSWGLSIHQYIYIWMYIYAYVYRYHMYIICYYYTHIYIYIHTRYDTLWMFWYLSDAKGKQVQP